MKIIHIANMSMGGISRLVTDLANAQHKQGHQLAIYSPLNKNNFLLHELHPEIPFTKGKISSGFSLNILSYLKLANRLKVYDVVHVHAFNALLILCLRLNMVKCIYTEHGTFQKEHQTNSLKNIIKKRLIGRLVLNHMVHGIALNSHWMLTNSQLKNKNQQIIYNGIPIEPAYPPVKNSSSSICLSVGRLEPKKRTDVLIQMFSDECLSNVALKIIGSGTQFNKLQKQAQHLKCDNVHLLGRKENVAEYYKQAQVFILGSKNEPFGLVVLEAVKYGCLPLIFTDSGGACEILQNKFNQLICCNANDMKSKLTYWLQNETERLDTVHSLQNEVLKKFSDTHMAVNYLSIYQQITTKNN